MSVTNKLNLKFMLATQYTAHLWGVRPLSLGGFATLCVRLLALAHDVKVARGHEDAAQRHGQRHRRVCPGDAALQREQLRLPAAYHLGCCLVHLGHSITENIVALGFGDLQSGREYASGCC